MAHVGSDHKDSRQTDRQADRQTDRYKNRQKDGQRDRRVDRHRCCASAKDDGSRPCFPVHQQKGPLLYAVPLIIHSNEFG